MVEIKLFNKWDTSGVVVSDQGLKKYLTITPIIIPRGFGRNSNIRFGKSKSNIVERLMNKLMVTGHKGKKHYRTSGHMTGKVINVYGAVVKSFEILEQKTKKNPVQVFITALENAAPREEITTIEYGGARYPQAVDCAPQRRIDIALRQIAQGTYSKSFGNKRTIAEALAEEILSASRSEQSSQAVSKKLELERQASSSR